MILNKDLFNFMEQVELKCTAMFPQFNRNGRKTLMFSGGRHYTMEKNSGTGEFHIVKTDDETFYDRYPDGIVEISDWELERYFTVPENPAAVLYGWTTDADYINGTREDTIEACITKAKAMYLDHENMFDDEDVHVIQIGLCQFANPKNPVLWMIEDFTERINDYICDNYHANEDFIVGNLTEEDKMRLYKTLMEVANEKTKNMFTLSICLEYDLATDTIIKDYRKKENNG